MRNWLVWTVLSLIIAGSTYAKVSTVFYINGSDTPLSPIDTHDTLQHVDYGGIMVGTQLTISIESDLADPWTGFLVLDDDSRDVGELSYRGMNGYDSVYSAAGTAAGVFPIYDWWMEPDLDRRVQGFHFRGGLVDLDTGPWFIVDYSAAEVGELNMAFYGQQDHPPFDANLIQTIAFQQVPSRDFNLDTYVDFYDFSLLASHWSGTDIDDPNELKRIDLDSSDQVDVRDVMLFSQYWLARTKITKNLSNE